jgi:hypothetical protein
VQHGACQAARQHGGHFGSGGADTICTSAGATAVGVAASVGAKRKLAAVEDDTLADSQKKALMTRKQRKIYEGLRRQEDEKAARVAALERKRDAAKASEAVR